MTIIIPIVCSKENINGTKYGEQLRVKTRTNKRKNF